MDFSTLETFKSKSTRELDRPKRKVFFVNQMMNGYGYYDEGEFATSIAAAAFSINSLEDPIMKSSNYYNKEKHASYRGDQIPINRANTRKLQESNYNKPPQSHESIPRRSSHKDYSSVGQATEWKRSSSTRYRGVDGKADAWEKSAMEKIGKRYEKLNSTIIAWEKEKGLKAKLEMEKKKRELELKKELNLQHYQNKIARINNVAEGARMQMEEKRKNEESQVKETTKRMRSRGKVPISWFCFSC